MTKADLIEKLMAKKNLPLRQARLIVDTFFDVIADGLAEGEGIVLRGFGSFSVRDMNARQSRNPRTGVSILTKAHKKVAFKAGSDLKSLTIGAPKEQS